MLQLLKNNLKNNFLQYCLILIGLTIFVGGYLYQITICTKVGCDEVLRAGFIKPLMPAGSMLIILVTPFLFLKKHFFIAWLKWLAAPIVLITMYAVLNTDVTPQGAFPAYRADVIETLTMLWLALTIVFVFVHWFRTRQK